MHETKRIDSIILAKPVTCKTVWYETNIMQRMQDLSILLRGLEHLIKAPEWPPGDVKLTDIVYDITKRGIETGYLTSKQADYVRKLVPAHVFALMANRRAGNLAGLSIGVFGVETDKAEHVIFNAVIDDKSYAVGSVNVRHAMHSWFDLDGVVVGHPMRLNIPAHPVGGKPWWKACALAGAVEVVKCIPRKYGIDVNPASIEVEI